jgi:hypothetical protein
VIACNSNPHSLSTQPSSHKTQKLFTIITTVFSYFKMHASEDPKEPEPYSNLHIKINMNIPPNHTNEMLKEIEHGLNHCQQRLDELAGSVNRAMETITVCLEKNSDLSNVRETRSPHLELRSQRMKDILFVSYALNRLCKLTIEI